MKKILCVILSVFMALSLTSCSKNKSITTSKKVLNTEVKGYLVSEELPLVGLNESDYENFVSYLNYDNINCPYSELFDIQAALAEKQKRSFKTFEHTYDFFKGNNFVSSDALYEVVKANNKSYMENDAGRHFREEMSDSELMNCCNIVADTLNWGIENAGGVDLAELGCIIGNLKILNQESMNYGTYSDDSGILNISPRSIKTSKNPDLFEITVAHEAMHILQSYCTDIITSEKDSCMGTSYAFENLAVNSLKRSWLFEASAELNTTLRMGIKPTTYRYMINNLESISFASVLDDNIKARQLEKICFTKNDDALYAHFGFNDNTKAMEALFAIELLCEKTEDFKTAYEKAYGTINEDYSEFLKNTYNPYVTEVLSKLLYKNLAKKLTQHEISLNDVFYIISVYELELLKDIPLDNQSVKQQYYTIYENYIDLQNNFFSYLQKYTDVNVSEAFGAYQANYDNGGIYANASLDWLESDKKDYILARNNATYKKYYKHIMNL